MRISLVTCAELPEPDFDEAPLREAFARQGIDVETPAWDDPEVRWGEYDACVLRSTWNYYDDLGAFKAWLARCEASGTRLINPGDAVRWNVSKGYLLELRDSGLPIVPTWFLPGGADPRTRELWEREGWEEIVLKPIVGAASHRTERFGPDRAAEAEAFAVDLVRDAGALMQRCMRGFESPGERSLVWIDGRWTHGVRKRPRYHGQDESVEASHPPTDQERAIGDAALARFDGSLLYARLDLVEDDDGSPLISELELIEPSLFFAYGEGSADLLASATLRACSGG